MHQGVCEDRKSLHSVKHSAVAATVEGVARQIVTSEDTELSVPVAAVYRAQFAPLMRVAFLLSDSAAAAEDAVQEAFLRCAPRLADIDHPPSYLRAAVVNECRAQHRRRARTSSAPIPDDGEDFPHELLETRAALRRLSSRKRAAIVLRYFVDIPDQDIAEILGCRPATVRTLLRRAIRDLKEDLA